MDKLPKEALEVYLKKRPHGMLNPDEEFGQRYVPLPDVNDLKEDEVLVHILWVSCDPAMRGWMSSAPSYIEPVAIGATMRAAAVGEVVAGTAFKKGQLVTGPLGWCEYAVANKSMLRSAYVPAGLSLSSALGVFGVTGLTAYIGLVEVGKVENGNAVVVTAAAGAVGSTVAQIAKNVFGCYTVGIAGGPEKCKYLLEELKLDAVIDYKDTQSKIGSSLKNALGHRKIDVFFDSVGGEMLEAGLSLINRHGRVVLCGAISIYNNTEPPCGPRNYMQLLVQSATMSGFVLLHFIDRFDEVLKKLGQWILDGSIKSKEDVTYGLENAPHALRGLFDGRNHGKVVVQVAKRIAALDNNGAKL